MFRVAVLCAPGDKYVEIPDQPVSPHQVAWRDLIDNKGVRWDRLPIFRDGYCCVSEDCKPGKGLNGRKDLELFRNGLKDGDVVRVTRKYDGHSTRMERTFNDNREPLATFTGRLNTESTTRKSFPWGDCMEMSAARLEPKFWVELVAEFDGKTLGYEAVGTVLAFLKKFPDPPPGSPTLHGYIYAFREAEWTAEVKFSGDMLPSLEDEEAMMGAFTLPETRTVSVVKGDYYDVSFEGSSMRLALRDSLEMPRTWDDFLKFWDDTACEKCWEGYVLSKKRTHSDCVGGIPMVHDMHGVRRDPVFNIKRRVCDSLSLSLLCVRIECLSKSVFAMYGREKNDHRNRSHGEFRLKYCGLLNILVCSQEIRCELLGLPASNGTIKLADFDGSKDSDTFSKRFKNEYIHVSSRITQDFINMGYILHGVLPTWVTKNSRLTGIKYIDRGCSTNKCDGGFLNVTELSDISEQIKSVPYITQVHEGTEAVRKFIETYESGHDSSGGHCDGDDGFGPVTRGAPVTLSAADRGRRRPVVERPAPRPPVPHPGAAKVREAYEAAKESIEKTARQQAEARATAPEVPSNFGVSSSGEKRKLPSWITEVHTPAPAARGERRGAPRKLPSPAASSGVEVAAAVAAPKKFPFGNLRKAGPAKAKAVDVLPVLKAGERFAETIFVCTIKNQKINESRMKQFGELPRLMQASNIEEADIIVTTYGDSYDSDPKPKLRPGTTFASNVGDARQMVEDKKILRSLMRPDPLPSIVPTPASSFSSQSLPPQSEIVLRPVMPPPASIQVAQQQQQSLEPSDDGGLLAGQRIAKRIYVTHYNFHDYSYSLFEYKFKRYGQLPRCMQATNLKSADIIVVDRGNAYYDFFKDLSGVVIARTFKEAVEFAEMNLIITHPLDLPPTIPPNILEYLKWLETEMHKARTAGEAVEVVEDVQEKAVEEAAEVVEDEEEFESPIIRVNRAPPEADAAPVFSQASITGLGEDLALIDELCADQNERDARKRRFDQELEQRREVERAEREAYLVQKAKTHPKRVAKIRRRERKFKKEKIGYRWVYFGALSIIPGEHNGEWVPIDEKHPPQHDSPSCGPDGYPDPTSDDESDDDESNDDAIDNSD